LGVKAHRVEQARQRVAHRRVIIHHVYDCSPLRLGRHRRDTRAIPFAKFSMAEIAMWIKPRYGRLPLRASDPRGAKCTFALPRWLEAIRRRSLLRLDFVPDDRLAHVAPLVWEHIVLTRDCLWSGLTPRSSGGSARFTPRCRHSDSSLNRESQRQSRGKIMATFASSTELRPGPSSVTP
jgi:hypothetical protein